MSGYNAMQLFGMNDDPFSMMRNGGLFPQMAMMNQQMREPIRQDPFYGVSPFAPMFGGPRGMPMMPFQHPFAGMMSSMNDISGVDNVHSFSTSSVMSMSTGPDGRPQVYQSSSSSRSVPGGVKETRTTESDSHTGVRKMAIGHHINDRGHIIEKEMRRGGDLEERQEFLNIDEEEATTFDAEFRRKTQGAGPPALEYRRRQRGPSPSDYKRSTYRPALPSARRRPNPLLAISSGASGQEDRQRDRKHRKPRSNN